jgi:hypothetical protein
MLGTAGCGRPQVAVAQDQAEPAPQQARQPRPENRQARTPLMRALLDAVDVLDNVRDEDRDSLRKMLLAHDEALHRTIGGSAKDAVLRAQRRHPRLVNGAWPRLEVRPAQEELPAPRAQPAAGSAKE